MTTARYGRRRTIGRRRLLALMGLGGAGVIVFPALGNGPIGKVVSIDGLVELERDTASLNLSPDDPLMIADRVMTREDGFALLLLDDRTKINLGASSELTIDQFIVDQGGTISMGGAMLFDRPADLPPTDITILTAFGQIGVRGTTFFAGPTKGKFSVFVDHGSVSVTGGGEERILVAGEGVEFEGEGAPPGPVVKWGQARVEEAYASVRVGR
ncbi:FecR family protein [Devosia sp. SL43]|uniref:FecR family protein n=1 Tax=Devosia sp. SL43 TaxID=2806348 RepID=UPI001F19199B|nr:FecR family protein [Devosia sp. SL43]UJW87200.1 FecR domain-containing protein [Devosia sp. SL43]